MANTAGVAPGEITVQVTRGNVTEADLAEFRNAQAAFEADAAGEQFRHMDAGRHDMDPRGIESVQEPLQIPAEAPQLEQPNYAPQGVDPDAAFWRQRYGQSENEKGDWRRVAQESLTQVQQLQQQMADLAARVAAPPPQPAYVPQPQWTPPPQLPNPLANKSPDDPITVAEQLAYQQWYEQTQVIPALDYREQRAMQTAYQRAMGDAQRQFGGWDVTPAEEQATRAKFPFIAQLSPSEANKLILETVRLSRAATANQPAPVTRPQTTVVGHVSGQAPQVSPPAAPSPVVVDPSRVMRRATYIESAPPTQIMADPTNTLSPTEAYQRALAAADAEARAKGLNRAPARIQRELLIRHFPNMPVGGDFGSGTLPG